MSTRIASNRHSQKTITLIDSINMVTISSSRRNVSFHYYDKAIIRSINMVNMAAHIYSVLLGVRYAKLHGILWQ